MSPNARLFGSCLMIRCSSRFNERDGVEISWDRSFNGEPEASVILTRSRLRLAVKRLGRINSVKNRVPIRPRELWSP